MKYTLIILSLVLSSAGAWAQKEVFWGDGGIVNRQHKVD